MLIAFRQTVIVQEGGVIEIRSPELPVGAQAEVVILLETQSVDAGDEWSEEDLRDFSRAGWELINKRLE